ncbi:NifU family protein [Porphyromonas sp.]|uniref:NifU family protein n=1 Tax=Porphyromonas sp. TaxID=1924944 RepID=UPI0026DBDCA4|nr:NifU family protein [Porphyromonas sp.]MDO4771871.1 NifU family protein [Porphyromonas sp.]
MSTSDVLNPEEVALVLQEKVSPILRGHGGDLVLSHIRGKSIYIRFTGACRGCPAAFETAERTVQAVLREHFGDEDIDAILDNGVSEDLIKQAKEILQKSKK